MKRAARPDDHLVLLLAAAAAGLSLCAAGLFVAPRATLAGWLMTAVFLLGLPLGAMTLLMVHGLTGGRWGDALRPPLRAAVATLPVALLLMLPVLARLDLVFPWAGADPALTEAVRQKMTYLNVPFFVVRFIVYAVVWLALAWLVLGWTAPGSAASRTGGGYAIGLVAHGFAVTVFAIDWMMSIEPDFSSTIYAMLEAAAEVVGVCGLALAVLSAGRAIESAPGGEEDVALGEDLANMMFGFMLIWAYLAFMQWLVVWGGDLPDEIHWYVIRGRNGWQYLLWLLIALQFALPFAGFLNRSVKRSRVGLIGLGAFLLAGHFDDVAWRVRPALSALGAGVSWPDLAAMVGAGGIWFGCFVYIWTRPDRIVVWRGRLARG
ncbi:MULTISPECIES: hypothetical protein [unclassified Mesorhizobium]|uniref:hypothetical protein n=1 Tax=unclassified Mesorhizobium TaxID=325217 RepID=UPI001126E51F|nr:MULTISPECIES: hypothetical protein [unclassified Mesorhizobium]TPL17948.1 hypothetical protein FJ952_13745 [Mesorhizobium sp. B2-4-10]TPM21099.1 hypothetical protein FJ953_10550 [Mesorhizobium sp. B2-3-6]